ncbi:MAG TPA: hypothetical protein VLT35_02830 [Methanocella sp.]|nr:hypothetical protein [Methanocella sp.]
MLIPSTRVVFEGLSRDYYARQKELAASGFSGCVRLAFADFEGAVFYEHGRPLTGLEECGTWMALGEELIAPLENKAVVTDGSMAIYELSGDLIDFFRGRKIGSTVETETGPQLGVRVLIDNLLRDGSACIFKARGATWVGYAFIAGGRAIDATYASDRERLEGGRAVDALRKASGKATAVLYFLEGGAPFAQVVPSVEMPSGTAGPATAPVEVMRPPAPGPVDNVIATPPPAETALAVIEAPVKVIMSGDQIIQLRHPSKLAALETLEDRSVVWVDAVTLEALGVKDGGMAGLTLPGGRTEQVTLLKMDLLSAPGRFAVVPRKLRRRLAIVPGITVILKPGSALVPVH